MAEVDFALQTITKGNGTMRARTPAIAILFAFASIASTVRETNAGQTAPAAGEIWCSSRCPPSGGIAVEGGTASEIAGSRSTIPGGPQGESSLHDQTNSAAGGLAETGNSQDSIYVLRGRTIGTFAVELFLDGSSKRFIIARGSTMAFDMLIVARSSIGTSAGLMCRGVIKNVAGRTAFVGTPVVAPIAADEPSWKAAVSTDLTGALKITVRGAENREIRWVATIRTAEVAW